MFLWLVDGAGSRESQPDFGQHSGRQVEAFTRDLLRAACCWARTVYLEPRGRRENGGQRKADGLLVADQQVSG